MSQNNLYKYKAPKSGNEETGFFNINGRITSKAFFLRVFFSLGLYILSALLLRYVLPLCYFFDNRVFVFFETIHFYILPIFIITFNLIQGAKRMHDLNKSGWFFLIPIYNIFLAFSPGNNANNDYGIDPAPIKNIQFFDELDLSKKNDIENHNPENKSNWDTAFKPDGNINNLKVIHENKSFDYFYLVPLLFIIGLISYLITSPPNFSDTYSESGTIAEKNDSLIDISHLDKRSKPLRSIANESDSNIAYDSSNIVLDSTMPIVMTSDSTTADKNYSVTGEAVNEPEEIYHFEKVAFENKTRNKIFLCVAYKHKNIWYQNGWFVIPSKKTYYFQLPKFFKDKEVYWYAEDKHGFVWSRTGFRTFYIPEDKKQPFVLTGNFIVNSNGSWNVAKDFSRLILSDVITKERFSD